MTICPTCEFQYTPRSQSSNCERCGTWLPASVPNSGDFKVATEISATKRGEIPHKENRIGVYTVVTTLKSNFGCDACYRVRYEDKFFDLFFIKHNSTNGSITELFTEEANLLKILDHISLPRMYDYFEDSEGVCFVLNYANGQILRDYLDASLNLPKPDLILYWAIQLAEAISLLHQQIPFPVVHGQINLDSLIITRFNDIQLINYGLFNTYVNEHPEIDANLHTIENDLVAFGSLLWLLLTGTESTVIDNLDVQKQIDDHDHLRSGLKLVAINCLQEYPKNYRDMKDILTALTNINSDLSLATGDIVCECGFTNRSSSRFCIRCGQLLHPSSSGLDEKFSLDNSLLVNFDENAQNLLLADFRENRYSPIKTFRLRERLEELQSDPGFDQLICLDGLSEVQRLPHQQEAALKILQHMRGRGLLADEVGLGKTIEAGLVIKELILRQQVTNILILCPPSPSLLAQWQSELYEKFDEIFLVLHRNIDTSLAWLSPRLIAPYTIVEQRFYAEELLKNNYDLVILDEAHYLNEIQNEKTLQVVQNLSKKYFLLLSATPMHNDVRELYNIVNLLRPGHFPAWSKFEIDYIDVNDPSGLKQENVGKLHDVLQQVMVRNRRKEVTKRYESSEWKKFRFPKRSAFRIPIYLPVIAPDAYKFYQRFRDFYKGNLKNARNSNFVYSRMGELVERFTSSPIAFGEGINERANAIKRQFGASFLGQLQKYAITYPRELVQPKIDAAIEIACGCTKQGSKVLVFSQFNETACYAYRKFEEKIKEMGLNERLFLYDEDKDYSKNEEALHNFVNCTSGILFCPGEMSEGVNLQFANIMINLDLPWDPMKIEQRIGRIQRLTSRFEKVDIYNLFLTGTIEEDILGVLESKLRMFNAAIGETDEIIGNLNEHDDPRKMFHDVFTGQVVENENGESVSAKEYINQEIDLARKRAEKDSRMAALDREPDEEQQEREGW